MDAVKFLEELKRMCQYHDECKICPFTDYCTSIDPAYLPEMDIFEIVSIVEKWSNENPLEE